MKQLVKSPIQYRIQDPQKINPAVINAAVDGLIRWADQVSRVINNLVSNIPSDSTASDVPGVVSDLNDLLAVLRNLDVR